MANFSGLVRPTGDINIKNDPFIQIYFPNLNDSQRLSLSNINTVDLPMLTTLGALNTSNNYFSSFYASNWWNLISIAGGDFLIVDNGVLKDVQPPLLGTIGGAGYGGFTISSNPVWQNIAVNNLKNLGNTSISENVQSLANTPEKFRINTTASRFECAAFDKLFHTYTTKYRKYPNPEYSCESHFEGHGDTVEHWKPPRSLVIVAAEIAIPLALSLLLLYFAFRWWRRRSIKLPTTQADDNVELDEVGTVRVGDSDEHRPPQYTRVGTPGEVPPENNENVHRASRDTIVPQST